MSKDLTKACLGRIAMSEKQVQKIYDRVADMDQESSPVRWIKSLCLSHERLRAELAGAESLLNESKEKHCPRCGSIRVRIFTSDLDQCEECSHTFN